MKRFIIALGLFSMPLCAMEPQKEQSFVEDIQKYIDVKKLFLGIGGIFGADEDSSSEESDEGRLVSEKTRDVINLCINSVKLMNLPIKIGSIEGTLEEVCTTKKLKALLKAVNTDYCDGNLYEEKESKNDSEKEKQKREKKRLKYWENFKKCFKWDVLKEKLGNKDYIDIEEAFNKCVDCFSGKEIEDVSKIMDIEKLPEVFGIKIVDYCNIDFCHACMNQMVQKKQLNRFAILDCFKLDAILMLFGCNKDRVAELRQGLVGLISFTLDLVTDESIAFEKLLKFGALIEQEDRKKFLAEKK